MNPRIKQARPAPGYRLSLTIANGETGTYDCRPVLDLGVFRELRDEAYFRQARVEGGTVVWPHGQDICPDTLYQGADKPGKRARIVEESNDLDDMGAYDEAKSGPQDAIPFEQALREIQEGQDA